ncbi:Uncharacterized protein LSUB1_G009022, partial [Lachnellula subtilissima]
MTLTILSDETIQSLLCSLNRAEILAITENLARALSEYSANASTGSYASRYQPQRTGITSPAGQLTLFMPFTSRTTIGTKIISLPPATPASTSTSSTSKSPAPAPAPAPKGVVTLLDASGNATGLLNAAELTAFRTSLASMILFKDRRRTGKIVVFGAGKQALWHIRLALLLKGEEIEMVTIVNRSTSRAEEMLKTIEGDGHDQAGSKVGAKVRFEVLDPLIFGYAQRVEERLADADVVFCCTPSARPLFPARFLVSEEKMKRGCYVTAIGSHSAEMTELDPAIFTTVVNSTSGSASTFHPTGGKGGVIVVDSRKSCLLEAGEIIQGKIGAESLVDVGELVALEGDEKEGAREWLESG